MQSTPVKGKIEIQLLSSVSNKQLLKFRDEIRLIEGMESFELKIPSVHCVPGTMGGSIEELIVFALMEGTLSAATAMGWEKIYELIMLSLKKASGNNNSEMDSQDERLWEAIVTGEENERLSSTYINSQGDHRKISNREYSINAERTYAILIGISNYDDRGSFSSIPPACRNVDDFYQVLNDKRLIGLPLKNISLLKDESSLNIKKEISKICKLPDIETLILYFAGHGQSSSKNQLSLIAKDTNSIENELHNDVSFAFIDRAIKNSKALQKIIFIDSCQSGLATQKDNNITIPSNVEGSYILASCSAEESSYFDKNSDNTYFTSSLLGVFRNGINNTNEMISLNDLFEITNKEMINQELPSPTYKNEFKNITPENFFISINPAFSLDELLKTPQVLYKQGNYEEARDEYLKLETKYPNNELLKNEHIDFEKNLHVKNILDIADNLFWKEQDFQQARTNYQEAYNLKNNELILHKILDCDRQINKAGSKNESPKDKKKGPILSKKLSKRITFSVIFIIVCALIKVFILDSPDHDKLGGKVILRGDKPEHVDSNKRQIHTASISDSTKSTLSKISNPIVETKSKQSFREKGLKDDLVEDSVSLDSMSLNSLRPIVIEGKKCFNNKDYKKAFSLLRNVSGINDPELWCDLGYMYANGKGVIEDDSKAVKWYLKSAAKGNAYAQNNIGWMYANGKGVLKNQKKAFEWYKKSAENDFAAGQNNLGIMYEQGIGIRKNIVAALNCYRKAAKNGSSEAADNLKRIGMSD